MSDHRERACFLCGSLLHHEDDCNLREPVGVGLGAAGITPPETPMTDAATWIADSISDPDGIPVVRADVCKAIELENTHLTAQLEEARRAFEQLAQCRFTDWNCASFEVANKRIRNIANKALAALSPKQDGWNPDSAITPN